MATHLDVLVDRQNWPLNFVMVVSFRFARPYFQERQLFEKGPVVSSSNESRDFKKKRRCDGANHHYNSGRDSEHC